FWASLGPGSISQAAHPAIAIAGSTRSRALEPPNDDQTLAAIATLSVLCAAPIGCATQQKSRIGVTPYGSPRTKATGRVRHRLLQSLTDEKVSCGRGNIAASADTAGWHCKSAAARFA